MVNFTEGESAETVAGREGEICIEVYSDVFEHIGLPVFGG